jgi:outer membrane autotransporter protein
LKTKLMAGASALTLMMIATDAYAVAPGECGVPNTSADPNVASCISDSTEYQDGITYDQSNFGTPANIKVDLYGTVVVNATNGNNGVTVIGSTDHDALIGARNGAKVTAAQAGLMTQAFGTGNARIDNHGTVNSGMFGAAASASGTGTASIVNAADGRITVTQTASGIPGAAGLAVTGSNGSASNLGTVTVNASGTAGSVAYGIGGLGLGGGTLTLTNGGSLSVTNTDGDAQGIGTLPSAGNLVLDNGGTLTVTSGTGKATGLGALGDRTVGTTAITNTGALSVTSQSGEAVGMSAVDRSDVAMAATRTSAASAFSVSGADATGFDVTGATGAVSVTGTGQYVQVRGADVATGVSVSGGTTQTVAFTPGNLGGTAYSGDLDVQAANQADGVVLSGATGAVSVGFTGANLTVSSTGAGASGIAVSGGSSVDIAVVPGSGNGASLMVDAAGGDAFGVTTSGASGAQSVTMGDSFAVTSNAGGATGIRLVDGTDQTVTLAQGATVTGGTDATGIQLAQGSGALAVTSQGALTVTGGMGDVNGIRLRDGASQTIVLDKSLTVSGMARVDGIEAEDSLGDLAITLADTFEVTSTGGDAVGFTAEAGGDVTVDLAKGLTVRGSTGAGGGMLEGSGDLSLVSAQDFSIVAENGQAVGGYMFGGTSQLARFDGDVTISGTSPGIGFVQSSATGPVSLSVAGDFVGTNVQQGLAQMAGTAQSIDLSGSFSVTSDSSDFTGIMQFGASESANLIVDGAFDVSAAAGSATGLQLVGANASVSLAQGMTVSAAGAAATGLSANLSGDAGVALGGALTVSNGAVSGSATGLSVDGAGAQSLAVSGPVTISADGAATGFDLAGGTGSVGLTAAAPVLVASTGGTALGLSIGSGADQAVTLGGAITVTGAGSTTGVVFANGTGTASLDLGAALSVTSSNADATGIFAANGNALDIAALADVTVSAAADAIGVESIGFTGAQNVLLGQVSVTAASGSVSGVSLSGSGAITLSDAGSIIVSGQGGHGVSVEGTGADGSISVSLANVQTSGDGVIGVNLAQTAGGSSGDIVASLGAVTTTGADADGVMLGVIDGTGSVTNLGTISTTGTYARGLSATASGAGAIAIDPAVVTTSGRGADGISVQTGSGAQDLTVKTVTVGGSNARGIVAESDSGAITLTATTVSASGDSAEPVLFGAASGGGMTVASVPIFSADAIALTSGSGTISATLVAGGSTTSASGAGLVISTGGDANVALGTGARLHGATVGLSSYAGGGQAVALAGTVGADSDLAVALSGGAATLTNTGTIEGYMTFDTASTALTNGGTWNAHGGDTSFAGNAVLTNTGTINVNPAATAAATMRITGLTTLRNSGTISLVNGHTGDVLDLGNAALVGSGNSRVVLEANLGASAVGGNAAQSADQLNVGAVSGTTTIAIKDLSGATAAQFNFDGIRLVNAASVANGAFVLEGGAVNKGFVDYQLLTDADGNLDLVGVPSTQAFELVRTGAEVRHYWRRSGDAWSDQMRGATPHEGVSLWGQMLGGSETNRSRPIYSETVLGTATTFAPNLDVRDTWWGGQFGLDWGHAAGNGDWGVGLTGGYVSQEGKVKSTGDRIKLDGGNLGLYARYRSADGLFAHALAKLDRYSLKYDLGNGASAPKSNGTSYGVEVEAGYHIRTGMAFIEPSASASWTDADLDGFAATGGVGAKFDHVQSFYGRAGVRAGITAQSGGWALQPYVGVNWEGEMNGRPGATLSSGDQDLYFRDASEGGRGRWELGVQGSSQGLSAFAKVEGVTGSGSNGVGGRAGVSVSW